tara:strand:- start:492 stop:695 length:204 start_codon:yes stop_codon:yes gene_type:complete
MIDKFIYKCCGVLDRYTAWMNSIFLPKPKKIYNLRKDIIKNTLSANRKTDIVEAIIERKKVENVKKN